MSREEKEQYARILQLGKSKAPTPPAPTPPAEATGPDDTLPDTIKSSPKKKSSIKNLQMPKMSLIFTKKDKEAQIEIDKIHNSKSIKQEIKVAQ